MQDTFEEIRESFGTLDGDVLEEIFLSFNITHYEVSQDKLKIKIPVSFISNIEELRNKLKQVSTGSRRIFNATVIDEYLIIPTNNYRPNNRVGFFRVGFFFYNWLRDFSNNNNTQQKFFPGSSHLPKANSNIEQVQKSNDEDTKIPFEYKCPLTLSIMEDPVLCTLDGYTYERKAIKQTLVLYHRSPLTNKVMKENQSVEEVLVLNRNIKNLIDDFRKENPQLFEEEKNIQKNDVNF